MKKLFIIAFAAMVAMNVSAQMNVWENGGLAAQYAVENVDSVTFGITSATPESGTGKDGITPLLKIENDYWFISYDEGVTWQQEGKAKGEKGEQGIQGEVGPRGEKGDKGDSMFQFVTQDDNYVYFTLADGTVIKIAKGNDSNDLLDGDDYINFEDLNVLAALLDAGIDTNNDGYISYNEAAIADTLNMASNTSIVLFREFQYFTGIKYFSFYGCSSLYIVNLPNTLKNIPNVGTSSSPRGAFEGCKKLKSIDIPESCTKISERTFYNCVEIKYINLPSTLKRIEEYTFYGCGSLQSLDIPNSVYYIGGHWALEGTSLDTLVLPEQYTADALGCWNSNLTTIVWNSISYPTNYRLYQNSRYYYGLGAYDDYSSAIRHTKLSTIIFGEKVESLPQNLCYMMSALKTIYSKNPTPPTLSSTTFYKCNYIENVYVPSESIEEYKTEWSQFADKIIGYDFE